MDSHTLLSPKISESTTNVEANERLFKVRLDKWLWAARFFKTRAVARAAIEKGRVSYENEPPNPNREVEIGATLKIKLGHLEKTILVKGLSSRRRNTEEALELFEEKNTQSENLHSHNPNGSVTRTQLSVAPPCVTEIRRPIRYLRRHLSRQTQRSEMPHTSEEYEMC